MGTIMLSSPTAIPAIALPAINIPTLTAAVWITHPKQMSEACRPARVVSKRRTDGSYYTTKLNSPLSANLVCCPTGKEGTD